MNTFKTMMLIILGLVSTTVQSQPDIEKAKYYFTEFDKLIEQDNGFLWGQQLHKNMFFIDPETYEFVANAPIEKHQTTKNGNVYIGTYPKNLNFGNTSVQIDETPWTMVMWPLPKSLDEALEIMAHEAFHSTQKALRFETNADAISHLEQKDARILYRLEMNALYKCLVTRNHEHLRNALAFRKLRFEKYKATAIDEIKMETLEGLAQYTGYKLAYRDSSRLLERILQIINRNAQANSLSRSSAYASGVLYGFVLDESGTEWRKMAVPLFDAYKLCISQFDINAHIIKNININEIRNQYNYEEILKQETKRHSIAMAKIAEYTNKLVNNNPLILPLINMNISFNPGNVVSLGQMGNVYEQLVLKDIFGTLTATKGALLSSDYKAVSVSSPEKTDSATITGQGWKLELNEGFQLNKQKDGTYKIVNDK